MKTRWLPIGLLLTFVLIGCGAPATTAAPTLTSEGLVSPTTVEALLEAGVADPSVSEELYQENLALFDYDQQAPLDIREVTSWREGNANWIDLTYASPKGGRVPATLIVPDGRGPFAGVILMHGMPSNRQEMVGVGRQYADRGAVVMFIDAPFARPENVDRPEGTPTFSEQDREEQIQLTVDLRRAVDLLVARPDVDPDRLAYVGISYGGTMGGLLAGVEHRLQAYVLQVGDGGLVTHFVEEEDAEDADSSERYSREEARRWLTAMWPIEPIHFVGHAAPAALLFQNGTQDELVPPDDGIRYQRAGSEPKETLWYDAGHVLPSEAFRDQTEWLQTYIGAGRLFVLPTNYRASALVLDRLLSVWLLLCVGSLAFPLWGLLRGLGGAGRPAPWWARVSWILVCAVLGPLGLLAYLLSSRGRGRPSETAPPWRYALGAAVYGVAGTVLGWALTRVVLVHILPDASQAAVQAASYGVSFLLGWSAFRAPRLASRLGGRYGTALRRSTVAEVISVNLVFAGMVPLMTLMFDRWFRSTVEVGTPLFWAVTSLGAIGGVLAVFPYDLWLGRIYPHRWPTWISEVGGNGPTEDAVTTPTFAGASGILLLSFVLLGVSIAVSVTFLA